MTKTCKLSVIVYMLLILFYIIAYILACSVSACEKDGTRDATRGVAQYEYKVSLHDFGVGDWDNKITDEPSASDTVQVEKNLDTAELMLLFGDVRGVLWNGMGAVPILSSDTLYPPSPDTAREYMRVDTVKKLIQIPFTDWKWSNSAHDWVSYTNYMLHFTTAIDTIWLPKVQVWLTPEEMDKLKGLLNCGKHRWEYTGVVNRAKGCNVYKCTRCGELNGW